MKKFLICIGVCLFTISSCNDSFLDYKPETSLTEETAFVTYDNFKSYAWNLYSIFISKTIRQHANPGGEHGAAHVSADIHANYLTNSASLNNQANRWQWNLMSSTQNPDDYWNFDEIRRVNIMLRNIDASEMSDKDKEHWRSVGYFFRAYRYYDLLATYGDVPWMDMVLTDEDDDILYGKRTPRAEVAANMLRDLKYAEEKIKADGEGKGSNTVSRAVVRALMSRFCLFEGTWRKYHGLAEAEVYLNECKRVSKLLMDEYPSLPRNYVDLWTSVSLAQTPGVILYREFLPDIIMSAAPRDERGGSKVALHARTVGRYLCQDGRPIATSPMYEGKGSDASVYDEFKKRDHRLYWRCIPPYRTNKGASVKVTEANKDSWWDEEDGRGQKERYYIDYMNNLNEEVYHFPIYSYQLMFKGSSPLIDGSETAGGDVCNLTGYHFYMLWTKVDEAAMTGVQLAHTDVPIFHMGEILLNYAEAMHELGEFSQPVADRTINKLRARANVASMNVSDINESFDPERDPKVTPMAWEIRRERMVELIGEGFGFYDIRRWKRAEYFINQRPLGVKIAESEKQYYFPNAARFITNSHINPESSVFLEDVGRVECTNDFMKLGYGWKEHYYLNPIPKTQTVLNDNLVQNPGWD